MARSINLVALAAGLACILAGCESAPSPSPALPALHIGVDSAAAPLVTALSSAYENQFPGFVMSVEIHERGALVDGARSGAFDGCVLFGNDQAELEFQTPIGYAALAIVAAPKQTISDIRGENLRAVYQGAIVNWRELGGVDAPIQPVAWPHQTSERLAFDSALAIGGSVTTNARIVTTRDQLAQLLRADSTAIGYYASFEQIDGDSHVLSIDNVLPPTAGQARNDYRLRVPLVIVSAHDPEGAFKEFLDWVLSPEGQRIVARYSSRLND